MDPPLQLLRCPPPHKPPSPPATTLPPNPLLRRCRPGEGQVSACGQGWEDLHRPHCRAGAYFGEKCGVGEVYGHVCVG